MKLPGILAISAGAVAAIALVAVCIGSAMGGPSPTTPPALAAAASEPLPVDPPTQAVEVVAIPVPATAPEPPPAVVAAPEKAAAPGLRERIAAIKEQRATSKLAHAGAGTWEQQEDIRLAGLRAETEFYAEWVATADLSVAAEPALSENSSPAEIERGARIVSMNRRLRELSKYAYWYKTSDRKGRDNASSGKRFLGDFLDLYLETHPNAR